MSSGKGLSFLRNKYWHPQNLANQKDRWVKEQTKVHRAKIAKRNEQALEEFEIDNETEVRSKQLGFMYKPPPGLEMAKAREENKNNAPDLPPGDWKCPKPECGFVNFLKNMSCKHCNTERPKDTYFGLGEKFRVLKNAPVENSFVRGLGEYVNHRPLGKTTVNIRCARCGEWGHFSGDSECRLVNHNPNDVSRKISEDPMAQKQFLGNDLDDNLVLRSNLNRNIGGYELLEEVEEDPEEKFLKTLTKKEKKILLKQLKKESEKKDKKSRKEKRRKHKDKSRKRKREPSDADHDDQEPRAKRRERDRGERDSRRESESRRDRDRDEGRRERKHEREDRRDYRDDRHTRDRDNRRDRRDYDKEDRRNDRRDSHRERRVDTRDRDGDRKLRR